MIQLEFTDKERGTMGSLNSLAGRLVFAAFSFLLGSLADRIIGALVTAALLSIIPMLLHWRVLHPCNKDVSYVPVIKG